MDHSWSPVHTELGTCSLSSGSLMVPRSFDVLVVGAGAAGLYAALRLPSHLQVGLLSKETLTASASDWAQGGVAAVMGGEDSFAVHSDDTLRAGAGLCDRPMVEFLVRQAPESIESLLDLGVEFDRKANGLALTLEAGHSHHRVLHAADATGRALVNTLIRQVEQRQNIQVMTGAVVLDLWLDEVTGRCQGVCLAWRGTLGWVRARAVVLATGGGGQLFAQTTNPTLSTGDGVGMAWRAGALLRDLEFFQFHPTALCKPGAPHFLISEAVRGEGAHLVDGAGRRFVFDFHPAGELAPRDVVSRGIFLHLQKNAVDPASAHVWLDLRPIAPETIRRRFPTILQVCQRWGIDVLQEPIPVAPAAHYWMGGLVTDQRCRTEIPGLYAVGEVASTGVHGANRLASNSLLECVVFGVQLAQISLSAVPDSISPSPDPPIVLQAGHPALRDWGQQQQTLGAIRQDLPRWLWNSAGICREGTVLKGAIAQVQAWRAQFATLPLSHFLETWLPETLIHSQDVLSDSDIRLWSETRNLLDIAYLVLTSADYRQESRGGHYRQDYPAPNADWQCHTLIRRDHWWRSPSVE